LFATALALALDRAGKKVILVDGDIGTGGLSYYLGLHYVRSIQSGLTELLTRKSKLSSVSPSPNEADDGAVEQEIGPGFRAIEEVLQVVSTTRHIRFLPVGNHTDIVEATPRNYGNNIGLLIKRLTNMDCDIIIIDCRGGVLTRIPWMFAGMWTAFC